MLDTATLEDYDVVFEGYIFFLNEEDGNVNMMDIYGENLVKL